MRPLYCVAAAVLSSCSSPEGPRIELSNATVELDAYSGRPNPRWELSVEEARDLSQRISDLEPARDATLPDIGLGYRGFYIDRIDGDRIFVSHGLIAFVRDGRPRAIYRDRRGAEETLQLQARSRGHGAAFERR